MRIFTGAINLTSKTRRRALIFDETSSADNTSEGSNHDRQSSECGDQESESNEQGSESNEQDSEDNEQDTARYKCDDQISQSNKLYSEAFASNERDSSGFESSLNTVAHDLSHKSPRCVPTTGNSTWSGLALHPHGAEQTMNDVDVWNQANSEPSEGDVKRPANLNLPQDRLPWVENLPDADFGWGWDLNLASQVSSSISPRVQDNITLFEIEDEGVDSWKTL